MATRYALTVGGETSVVGSRDASALLQDAISGRVDLLGSLDRRPLLVVDCDLDAGFDEPTLPANLPVIVVCISQTATHQVALDWFDIALTVAPDPPRPWVSVEDLPMAVSHLAAQAAKTPVAATMLCQILRCAQQGEIQDGLFRESLAYSALQGGPEFARWQAGRSPALTTRGSGPPVLISRQGATLTVTLNRPDVHNAYNTAMRDDLCDALRVAITDTAIDRVELTGNGPSFCSGGDLTEFGTLPDPATAHLIRTTRGAARLFSTVTDRLHVRLHGSCIGAGIELAAVADRITAERTTSIRLPEVAMGLIPGAGGTASLPRRIGRHRTAWLALSGVTIGAAQALSWGLVDRLA